jgi:hypothetical protein
MGITRVPGKAHFDKPHAAAHALTTTGCPNELSTAGRTISQAKTYYARGGWAYDNNPGPIYNRNLALYQ